MTAREIINLLAAKHSDDVFVPECKDGPTQTGSHLRLDAWAMPKSWVRGKCIGYEVKVSRSDFLRDDKYDRYRDLCHELYLVAPKGVLSVEELPADVGYIEVSTGGKRLITKRKAVTRQIEWPVDLLRYILMCRSRIGAERYEGDPSSRRRFWESWLEERKIDIDFGHRVSKRIGEAVRAEITSVRLENDRLKRENEMYADLKAQLDRLGIQQGSRYSSWSIANAVREKLDEQRHVLSREARQAANDGIRALTRLISEAEKMDEANNLELKSEVA